jgi:hypothetical protein
MCVCVAPISSIEATLSLSVSIVSLFLLNLHHFV